MNSQQDEQKEPTEGSSVQENTLEWYKAENFRLLTENQKLVSENEKIKQQLLILNQMVARYSIQQNQEDNDALDAFFQMKEKMRTDSPPFRESGLTETSHTSLNLIKCEDKVRAIKTNQIVAIGYDTIKEGELFKKMSKKSRGNSIYSSNHKNPSVEWNVQRKQERMHSIKMQEQQINLKHSKFNVNSSSKQIHQNRINEVSFYSFAGNSPQQTNTLIRQISNLSTNNYNNTPMAQEQFSTPNIPEHVEEYFEKSPAGYDSKDKFYFNTEDNIKSFIQKQDSIKETSQKEDKAEQPFLKLFEEVQNYGSIGDLFFEDFMVIGPSLEELNSIVEYGTSIPSPTPSNFSQEQSQSMLSSSLKQINFGYVKEKTEPKILFSKPGYIDAQTDNKRKSVASFAFPSGLEHFRFKGQKDLTNLPQRFKDIILFDLCEQKEEGVSENIFLLNLKGEEKPKVTTELVASNPTQIMYAICYNQNEVYIHKSENKNEYTLFMFPTVYCFLTYYPFINYFLELLYEIVNRVKTTRLILSSFSGAINNDLKLMDFESVLNSFKSDSELSLSLRTLQMQETRANHFVTATLGLQESIYPKLENISKAQTSPANRTFAMKVPPIEELGYVEASQAAFLAFSNLPYEDFAVILSLVMLEKKVIFLSKNITLLTFTVLTFQTLLKPLQYPHPVIFSLSEDLIYLLEAPVPILIGLHMTAQRCETTYGFNPECFYVDLDKNQIIAKNSSEISQIQNCQISFKPYRQEIKTLFKEISGVYSKQFGSTLKKVFKKNVEQKVLVYKPDKQQQDTLINLLKLIKKYLNRSITKKFPGTDYFNGSDESDLNMEYIQSCVLADSPDSTFLSKFVETQIFSYYAQQVYC